MTKEPCFWCSGMKWLGPIGRWFENTFRDCCKRHDQQYARNTELRRIGIGDFAPRVEIDINFFKCMARKGFWGQLLAPIAWYFVRLLYWPSRWVKFKFGKAKVM